MLLTKEQMELLGTLRSCDLAILPCSSTKIKSDEALAAKDLYVGGFFKKQRKLVEALGLPYLILSTKYGLITPDTKINYYNLIWSKKLKQDNSRMRNLPIPVATEAHRLQVAKEASVKTAGCKVLSFCSLHYKPYLPEYLYFNEEVGRLAASSSQRGIQYINKTMHVFEEYLNGTL